LLIEQADRAATRGEATAPLELALRAWDTRGAADTTDDHRICGILRTVLAKNDSLTHVFRPGVPIRGVVLSKDGTMLAVGTSDGAVRSFDLRTGDQNVYSPSQAPTDAFALTADGKRLATGGRDGAIRIWDTRDGELLADNSAAISAFAGTFVQILFD